jgi:hypothetical protein
MDLVNKTGSKLGHSMINKTLLITPYSLRSSKRLPHFFSIFRNIPPCHHPRRLPIVLRLPAR